MKQLKSMAGLFFVLLLFTGTAWAQYSVDFWAIQHRIYEDGRSGNRIGFSVLDEEGAHITDAGLVTEALLSDPNGSLVTMTYNFVDSETLGDCYYDTNNGQWHYGDWKPDYYYFGTVDGDLIPGTYTLKVTVDGEIVETTRNFQEAVNLPIVPANSYRIHLDTEGNLHWTWHVPDALSMMSSDYATQLRAFIDVYQDGAFVASGVYIKLPTHMGYCFVPKTILDKFRAKGNQFQFGIQVRTPDNNNRSYSLSYLVDGFGMQGYTYYLPHYTSEPGMWTALGLKNENSETATNVSITIYDETGAVVEAIEDKTIAANGQDTFKVAEGLSKKGWIMIHSDQPLQGVCFFSNTATPDYMTNIPLITERSVILTIPHAAQGPVFDTMVMIANPQALENKVTLNFTSQDGATLYSTETTLPPKGCWKYNLGDLIPDSSAANYGSIEVTGERTIVGFGLYYNLKTGGGASVAGSWALPPTYR